MEKIKISLERSFYLTSKAGVYLNGRTLVFDGDASESYHLHTR